MNEAIVIGGGVSGLRAATELTEAGWDVRVFEARDRLGGRLHDIEVEGAAFDTGATWFWDGEQHVAELVEKHGIAVFPQHLAGDALLHTADGVKRLDGNPIDVPSGRFVDGATSIVRALEAQLAPGSISTGTSVTSITRTANRLEVSAGGSTFAADHVVLAIPPVLAVRSITFSPPLLDVVEELASSTPVWMGATAKVVAVYETAFWREEGLAGSAISYVGPLREIHDMSAPGAAPGAIFGFAPTGNDPIDPARVIEQLVALFGEQARSPTRLEIHDWSAEEFTSPPGASTMTAYETYGHPSFSEPVCDGRVHWASTETSSTAPGHIEGALIGGLRAARAILHAS
jgi:monoamine oxidase